MLKVTQLVGEAQELGSHPFTHNSELYYLSRVQYQGKYTCVWICTENVWMYTWDLLIVIASGDG